VTLLFDIPSLLLLNFVDPRDLSAAFKVESLSGNTSPNPPPSCFFLFSFVFCFDGGSLHFPLIILIGA